MKDKIIKRVKSLPDEQLQESINKLQMHNIAFYNNHGEFSYYKFQADCIETMNYLLKTEKPNPVTNIRYELCYLMGVIGTIVGIRNLNRFISSL